MSSGILATVGLFVLSHIIVSVWWASRIDTVVTIVGKQLETIIKELAAMRMMYVLKEDLIARVALDEKEHVTLWRRLDELRTELKANS